MALGDGLEETDILGELLLSGTAFEKWSTVFVTADEAPPRIAAGDKGLDLLVLQFPKQPGPRHAT